MSQGSILLDPCPRVHKFNMAQATSEGPQNTAPIPRVQRTKKSSKNTVRTGVFVGHAVWHLINSVPKPDTSLVRSPKIMVRSVCWTKHLLDGGGGLGEAAFRGIFRHRLLSILSQHISGWRQTSESLSGRGEKSHFIVHACVDSPLRERVQPSSGACHFRGFLCPPIQGGKTPEPRRQVGTRFSAAGMQELRAGRGV